jgi:hypothetical protein
VAQLLFGVFAGAVGLGYIVYGRRQTKLVPVISGVLLCVYPYFIASWVWLSLVGAVLLAAPFFIDF